MATMLFLLIVFFRTVDSICKLLARKCEKRSVKRKIFVLLDLGKAKKYLFELDAAAKNIEVRLQLPMHKFYPRLAAKNGQYVRGTQGMLLT